MKYRTKSIAEAISIIIPTINRSNYLERLLEYYARARFSGFIYIGDSSEEVHLVKTRRALKKFEGVLHIIYNEYPHRSDSQTQVQLLSQVETPYVAYVADDDFLVPKGLEKCASFLEGSKEYSLCIGKALLLTLKSKERQEWVAGPYGNYRDILEDTASGRFLNFMEKGFVNAFAVHRTDQMKEAYKGMNTLSNRDFTELLPDFLSVLQGKVKVLDCFYLVRQHHESRYLLSDVYDWVTNENWFSSYQQFANRLASILEQKDNLSSERAYEIVKQGFWKYLASVLPRQWDWRYKFDSNSLKSRFKQGAKQFPLLAKLWRRFYSYTPNGKMRLQALLRKSSPYHADFLSVYQAIQNETANR